MKLNEILARQETAMRLLYSFEHLPGGCPPQIRDIMKVEISKLQNLLNAEYAKKLRILAEMDAEMEHLSEAPPPRRWWWWLTTDRTFVVAIFGFVLISGIFHNSAPVKEPVYTSDSFENGPHFDTLSGAAFQVIDLIKFADSMERKPAGAKWVNPPYDTMFTIQKKPLTHFDYDLGVDEPRPIEPWKKGN